MLLAHLALIGRILLIGYERIIFKQLGENSGSVETVFLIFSTGTVLLLPFLFFAEAPPDYGFLYFSCFAGLVYTLQTVLYIKSLSLGEASLVTPLYYFNVFFLLVLTTVFLGEPLTIVKIAGILLLVYGSTFLNRQQNIFHSLKALARDKACRFMIASSVLVAVGRTVDGFVVRRIHPLVYTFSLCLVTCLFLFVYLAATGRLGKAFLMFKEKRGRAVTAGAVDCYSYLLLMFAITRIEVSVAEPSTMLGLIVTVVLAHFVFRERIRERLVGAAIMIAGAWLLLG
ncbi:MAG TPA: DMT family transporter [archaeon]|nr:DMT family transporter [archaeon]